MESVRPYFVDSTPFERGVMRTFVGANFLVVAFCAFYLADAFQPAGATWPCIAGSVIVGYFVADFASGLVHWSVDTWFDERSLGRAIAITREHHTHPQHILGYGFLENSALGSAPSAVVIGAAATATALFPVSAVSYCFMIVWLMTSACLSFGMSFHNLCHRPASPLVRLGQETRLLIRPDEHWAHHRGDRTIRYCVINGWANRVCDPLNLWRRLEWLVQALTGAEPRRDDRDWQRRYEDTGTLLNPPR